MICFIHLEIFGAYRFNFKLSAGRHNYMNVISLVNWLEENPAFKSCLEVQIMRTLKLDPLKSCSPLITICDLKCECKLKYKIVITNRLGLNYISITSIK